jgi:hypothetical protein
MRKLYWLGCAYIAICVALFVYQQVQHQSQSLPSSGFRTTSGSQWFVLTRPYCNALEVETRLAQHPPPPNNEGVAYAASCFALAGKTDRARTLIRQLPVADQLQAAKIVLQFAHPIADAGDSKAAAPLMRLVLDFVPNESTALYHAGMAEYSNGEYKLAKQHLTKFLSIHGSYDESHKNAYEMVSRLEQY